MIDAASPCTPVRIAGRLRGRVLDGEGTLALLDDAIELGTPEGTVTMSFAAIDGVRAGGREMQLVVGGDVLVLAAERGLITTARDLVRRACALPELTLSLRGLGARRGTPDAEHVEFFAPFLAARRRAERVSEPQAKLTAFGAAPLRAAVERQLAELAARRYPASPPDRRSLEAELLECAEDVIRSLDRLEAAARAVRDAGDAVRLARWRHWTEQLRRVFECADACWLAMVPVLAERPRPRRSRLRRIRRWLGLATVLGVLLLVPGAAAQHVPLRVEGVAPESLLARGFDVAEVRRGAVIVIADGADRARLDALGWTGAPMWPQDASALRRAGLSGPTPTLVYRSFDDAQRGIAAHLDSMARGNPRVSLDTLGWSAQGRPILAAKVGPHDDAAERPNVLFMATYHAREWAATEMALRLLRYLARLPAPDLRVDSLVARRDIWILPVVNPDGYQFTFDQERLWRKNRRVTTSGEVGVDLNRNHAAFWGRDDLGSSPNPDSEVYRGPAPESEPETRAVVAFHAAHPPVIAVSYHTYAGLLLYPWGHEFGKLAGDWGIFRALAGTDVRPAVRDRLPGALADYYRAGPGWTIYTTNGEYTDWAYSAHGALAFTPELTSGWEGNRYYGFEFPDDEDRLQRLFLDNLPFALDLLDAARAPLVARPRETGISVELIGIEAISPAVRVRVPVEEAQRAVVRTGVALALTVDTAGGGRYTTRLLSGDSRSSTGPEGRPAAVTVELGRTAKQLSLLAATGAEDTEVAWPRQGFLERTDAHVGGRAWWSAGGVLRSPPIDVPARVDSVSVLFWTRHDGSAFDPSLRGEIHVSVDRGTTWDLVGALSGLAPVYYPARVDVIGVGGRTIEVEFRTDGMGWWLDEITIVAHDISGGRETVAPLALAPSQNPLRHGNVVYFRWPFTGGGELSVFDLAGRLVWHRAVGAGATSVLWDVAESGSANGVYLVVARGNGRAVQQKLFVARSGR